MLSTLRQSGAAAAWALAAVALPIAAASGQTIRTVRSAGPGSVAPWTTAVASLEVALAASQPGDEVWIAEGTYAPTTAAGFVVPSNVGIYGGFAGTESRRSERSVDPAAHRVTLNRGGNCLHVMNVANAGAFTTLDRVSISTGPSMYLQFTPTSASAAQGPCLYATNSSIACSDCIFADSASSSYTTDGAFTRDYHSGDGGAISLNGCNSTFTTCSFVRNRAGPGGASCTAGTTRTPGHSGHGGAVFIANGSCHFVSCAFDSNRAGNAGTGPVCAGTGNTGGTSPAGEGGAIYATNAALTLSHCRFTANAAGAGATPGYTGFGFMASAPGGAGGGVAVQGGALMVDACEFSANAAGNGSYGGSLGPPEVQPGSAGGSGGAIRCSGVSSARIQNSVFLANLCGNGGSANTGSTPWPSGGDGGTGGAISCTASNVVITNSTFAGNLAGTGGAGTPNGANGGAGAVAASATTATISNSILWGNSALQQLGASTLVNNCVQSDPAGDGGINADPLFLNLAGGDVRLSPNSPCINAGSNAAAGAGMTMDRAGNPRFAGACAPILVASLQQPTIDIGAYEVQQSSVDCNADGVCDSAQVLGTAAFTRAVPQDGALFGWSLAIAPDAIAIGARSADVGSVADGGEVALYERSGGFIGSPTVVSVAPVAGEDFGNQVVLTDQLLVVGARFSDVGAVADAGCAYVYRRRAGDLAMMQRLTASDGHAGDAFAHGLSADGTVIVAGALLADAANAPHSGAAYVYRLASDNTFTQEARLVAGDAASGDGLGISVGISGGTIVAGAPYHSDQGVASGAAYIFEYSGGTWTQTARLIPPSPQNGETFGELVAIKGDVIAVNAPRRSVGGQATAGSVCVYRRVGGSWQLEATLASNQPRQGELFGFGLSLDTDALAAGGFARGRGNATRSGCAYLFRNTAAGWRLASRIEPPEPENEAWFGYAVSVAQGGLLIGAPQQTARGVARAGAVRLYDLALLDGNYNGVPDSCDIAAGTVADADHDGIPDNLPPTACAADFNMSGSVTIQDLYDFLGNWFARTARADFDHSGVQDANDIFAYIAAWFAGC